MPRAVGTFHFNAARHPFPGTTSSHPISELLPCCLLQTLSELPRRARRFRSKPNGHGDHAVFFRLGSRTANRSRATENERKSKQEFQDRIHHGFLQGIDSMLELENVRGHTLVTLRAPLRRGLFRYHDSVNRAFRATSQ